MKINKAVKHVGKVVAYLSREQVDFIDKIGKDALFSTGKKLSRSLIIQTMVEAFRKLNLTGNNVHSQDELEDKMLEVSKKALQSLAEKQDITEKIESEKNEQL